MEDYVKNRVIVFICSIFATCIFLYAFIPVRTSLRYASVFNEIDMLMIIGGCIFLLLAPLLGLIIKQEGDF